MEKGEKVQSIKMPKVSATLKDRNGIDVKADGDAVICSAAFSGEFDMVKKGIEAGAKVNCRANGSRTPLHFAAIKGHADIVKFLLENNAEVYAADDDGNTALHLTVYYGHVEVTRILINHGADVFAKTNHDSVLHKAARHVEILNLVLAEIKKKSNGDTERLRLTLNAPDTEGDTPLMWAIENGNITETELLLECEEIEINKQNLKGWTVLHWAAYVGRLDIVKLVLEKKVDAEIKDKNEETAFDLAYGKPGKISEDNIIAYQKKADFLLFGSLFV